jgi:caffeoyl-CoA O-methyltransferase
MAPLIPEEIEHYISAHTTPQGELLERLRQETQARMASPGMMVGATEGRLLTILARLCNARLAVEIGTFTGYSALCIAEGMADDGKLVTCDIDPDAVAIAQRYFAESLYGHRIELKLGPALESLDTLDSLIDFAFIDGDKENYPAYWEKLVPMMRTGGLIVVDNVLWSGKVLNPVESSDRGISELNARVVKDERVETVMLSVRDGVTVALKR